MDVLTEGIAHSDMEGEGQPEGKQHVVMRHVVGASGVGGERDESGVLPGGKVCIFMPLNMTGN